MRGRRSSGATVSFFAFQDIITAVTGVLIIVVLLLALLIQVPGMQAAAPSTELQGVSKSSLDNLRLEVQDLENEAAALQESMMFAARISPEELKRQVAEFDDQLKRVAEQAERSSTTLDDKRAKIEVQKDDYSAMALDLGVKDLEVKKKQLQSTLERMQTNQRVIYNFSDLAGKTAWIVDVGAKEILLAQVGVSKKPSSFRDSGAVSAALEFIRWADSMDANRNHFVLVVRPGGVDQYAELKAWLDASQFSAGVDVIDSAKGVIDPESGAGL